MFYCSLSKCESFDLKRCLGTDLAIKILRNGKYARISSSLFENGVAVIGKVYFTNPHFRGEWVISVQLVELLDFERHLTLRLRAQNMTELSQFNQQVDLFQYEFFLAVEKRKTLLVDYGQMRPFMEH